MGETTPAERATMRVLSTSLKVLRERAGIGTRALARQAGISSHAVISLAEAGKKLPKESDLTAILDVLGADVDVRTDLIGKLREISSPGRLDSGLPDTGDALTELIRYERDATQITDVALGQIPGLLQTSDYARAIMSSQPDLDRRVAMRMGRRDILDRLENPAKLVALIDSEVLVRPIIGVGAMRSQLRFLLRMAERPNVTIRLVSSTRAGWHPGLCGPFKLIEFGLATPVVHLEHYRSSLFLWEHQDVEHFQDAVAQIAAVAMTPAESAEAIAFLINGEPATTRGDDDHT